MIDWLLQICDYLPGRAFTSLSEQPFPLTSQTSFPTLNPTTLPLINATEQSITLSHLQSPDPEGFVPFTTDLFTASPPPPLDNSIDEGIHEIERDEKQVELMIFLILRVFSSRSLNYAAICERETDKSFNQKIKIPSQILLSIIKTFLLLWELCFRVKGWKNRDQLMLEKLL